MLKQRVITVLWLLPLALFCLWVPSARPAYSLLWWGAQALVGLLFIGAALEWAKLMRFQPWLRLSFVIGTGLVLGLMSLSFRQIPVAWIGGLALAWWGLALLMVLRYQVKPFHRYGGQGAAILMGACLLLLPYYSFLFLKAGDTRHNDLFYVVLLVWCTDTGAYFVGKSLGKRKWLPRISPGKTQEGLLGGILSAWLLGAAIYVWADLGSDRHFWPWMVWVSGIALAAILGDSLESVFKRIQGVKDSGRLLAGHGGILDRIDALLAALPIAVATQPIVWLVN